MVVASDVVVDEDVDVDDDTDVLVLTLIVGIRVAAALGRETRFVVAAPGRATTAADASNVANRATIMPQMLLFKIPFLYIILI